jgi:hypothetical protein
MARWAAIGMVTGGILFSILFGYYYFTATRMTDSEKAEKNSAYAENCTKCLEKEHINCTVENLSFSQWGAICENKYISRNCSGTCRRI